MLALSRVREAAFFRNGNEVAELVNLHALQYRVIARVLRVIRAGNDAAID